MDGFIFHQTQDVETELSPEEMGRAFADGDSIQQAAFLNEAFGTMEHWPNACGVWQISYIAKALSPISKRLLCELAAHIDGEEAAK